MRNGSLRRIPPGRAGILRLRRSLAIATAGADLLARKLTVLSVEADRLAEVARDTGPRWRTAAAAAQRRLDLAGQIAGDRGLRLAVVPPQARVSVDRTAIMGLSYPDGARCELPARPVKVPPADDIALALAEGAVREAVEAAAPHAAAVRAAGLVSREAELTRRRLRALEHHRVPSLRRALDEAVARTEELEAADAVQRRWAASRADRPWWPSRS